MTYPLPTHFGTTDGNSVSTAAFNNVSTLVNALWVLLTGVSMPPSALVATVGTETFTVAAGSVTTINGTVIDGVTITYPTTSPTYILVKDAPATTGVGSVGSSQPANGLYQVTAVATNISVTRANFMSASGPAATPAGMLVTVMAGTVSAGLAYWVALPNTVGAFTYGSNNIQFTSALVTPLQTQTLTGKRITKRVGTTASTATPAINTDTYDCYKITTLATPITGWTVTGTPQDRDEFTLVIKDNGTQQAMVAPTTSLFKPSGATSFPGTTSPGKKMTFKYVYDADVSAWMLMAMDVIGY